jgi:hypothetical protein
MSIGPVDSATELVGQVSEGKWVADVKFDLKVRLPSIGAE